jgi:elongation factor Ts
MMDCRAALQETNGDFEAAIDFLRKKGQKVAANRADRESTEGAVIAKVNEDHTLGVVIALNCETDFVAKNADFKQLADDLAMHVAAFNPSNIEELGAQLFIKDQTLTVADLVKSAVQKFGERTEIMRFSRFEVGA